MDASAALARLQEGNRRFMEGRSRHGAAEGVDHRTSREALVAGQSPCAVILGCADSRVPPELVFDLGLGELFTIRVAGNFADTSQVGSLEYALLHLGVRLVVILGHSSCGAVAAAVQESQEGGGTHPEHLQGIVDRLQAVVGETCESRPDLQGPELCAAVGQAHAQREASRLEKASEVVQRMVREGTVQVVAAEYALETGLVTFLG